MGSITFNDKDINNVRKIEAISQVKEGAVVKQELGCQDIEYTQQIKKKIRALIDKVDADSGQYDNDDDNDNHDDDNQKLYYSVYDDDDDIIMGEDDDNEYYKYEAANEDFYEEDEDDTMNRIEYNMTYTEADDDARFCQVTTNADTRQRSRPMNKVGKYRQ